MRFTLLSYTMHVYIDHFITNLKNFETSNVQYTNVIVSLGFGIKGFVDSFDQPIEHTVIQRFSQGTNGVDDLRFILTLNDELGSDFDFGFEQAFQEVTSVDTQQEGDLFRFCEIKVKRVFIAMFISTYIISCFVRHLQIITGSSINFSLFTLLLECHFTHMHDRGGAFIHTELFFAGEAKNIKSFLHDTVHGINLMKFNRSNTK